MSEKWEREKCNYISLWLKKKLAGNSFPCFTTFQVRYFRLRDLWKMPFFSQVSLKPSSTLGVLFRFFYAARIQILAFLLALFFLAWLLSTRSIYDHCTDIQVPIYFKSIFFPRLLFFAKKVIERSEVTSFLPPHIVLHARPGVKIREILGRLEAKPGNC